MSDSFSPLNVSSQVDLEREFGVLDKPPFREISWRDIGEALETTIKDDFETKVITFVACLLAQTEEDQLNISFQSESASGKSYIALNVAEFFPREEVIEIAHASAKAFFHEYGDFDKETHEKVIDLEGKILVFLDSPDFHLLSNLRPLLSHDRKELHVRITDKTQAYGLATKHILLRGFPSVIFCTTFLNPDDQERTRLLFLSPSTSKEKLEKSIRHLSLKQANPHQYRRDLDENVRRNWLRRLVDAVRESHIREIRIQEGTDVGLQFLSKHPKPKPKDQRDFARILSLIKGHALINFRSRERDDFGALIANQLDVEKGFELYAKVSEANNLGVSPWTLKVYQEAIQPILTNEGISLRDFRTAYYRTFGHSIKDRQLRSLIEELEDTGLIESEYTGREKRIFTPRTSIPPTVAIVSSQGGEKSDQEILLQRQGGDNGKDDQSKPTDTPATAQSPTFGEGDSTTAEPSPEGHDGKETSQNGDEMKLRYQWT